MGCKIRYCIDKAVAIVSYVFQIGSVKVAHSHVFPQSFYATLLLWGEIFFYRKQNLDIIHDLFFRQPDSPQIFKLFSKSRHILVCQEQGILRFLDLSADIPCVDHRPAPLCRAQGKVKRIIAYYTDRGKRRLHRTGTVMGIGKYHVWADTLAGNDIFPWKSCKQPHPSPLLQGASCFVAHSFS